jgi:hypothetical protein
MINPNASNASNLGPGDYLWITFSAIIALLIFSNFQQEVHLTAQGRMVVTVQLEPNSRIQRKAK